jgi:hypothetical protein
MVRVPGIEPEPLECQSSVQTTKLDAHYGAPDRSRTCKIQLLRLTCLPISSQGHIIVPVFYHQNPLLSFSSVALFPMLYLQQKAHSA